MSFPDTSLTTAVENSKRIPNEIWKNDERRVPFPDASLTTTDENSKRRLGEMYHPHASASDIDNQPLNVVESDPVMKIKGNKPTPKDPDKFKHKCNTCGQRFTRATTLREHSRTHTGERPYVCEVCGASFSRFKDRNRHEGLHSKQIKFRCDLSFEGIEGMCGREFAKERSDLSSPYRAWLEVSVGNMEQHKTRVLGRDRC